MVKVEAKNYEVQIGTFKIINCEGTINLVGKGLNKQPFRFREGEDGKILLNCTIWDQKRDKVVVLHNSIVQHSQEGYDTQIEDKRIVVTNKATEDIWLDFEEISPNHFKINGIFYYPDIEIFITDTLLKVKTSTNYGEFKGKTTFSNCSNVLGIGTDGSFRIG